MSFCNSTTLHDMLFLFKKLFLCRLFCWQCMDHVSKQTVITNNSQVFVWRGIGQLSAIQELWWEKRKKECKNSFQFMDFMCTCKEMHIHQVSCYMYCRCTKQKECRFLRWGYKVCISQQESTQMFLVLSLSLLLLLLLHHKFTNFKSILFSHFFFFYWGEGKL